MADWLITTGFFAVLLGFGLRAIMMMRASDEAGTSASQHGRQLVRAFRTTFPGSPMPALSKVLIFAGVIAVAAGVGIQLRG